MVDRSKAGGGDSPRHLKESRTERVNSKLNMAGRTDLVMKEAGVEGQTDRHREAKREQN